MMYAGHATQLLDEYVRTAGRIDWHKVTPALIHPEGCIARLLMIDFYARF